MQKRQCGAKVIKTDEKTSKQAANNESRRSKRHKRRNLPVTVQKFQNPYPQTQNAKKRPTNGRETSKAEKNTERADDLSTESSASVHKRIWGQTPNSIFCNSVSVPRSSPVESHPHSKSRQLSEARSRVVLRWKTTDLGVGRNGFARRRLSD